jgi:hypothetical protein
MFIDGGTNSDSGLYVADGVRINAGASSKAALLLDSAGLAVPALLAQSGSASPGVDLDNSLGTGVGLRVRGGGSAPGIQILGGASGGAGVDIRAQGGNAVGVYSEGVGTGAGVYVQAGATGNGVVLLGGATSGRGLYCAAQVSGHGAEFVGVGTSQHGILASGGAAGTSNGIYAVGGTAGGNGIHAQATGGNGNGLAGTGQGTGRGIIGTPDIYPVASWSELEGAEPTGAIASNATFRQILQHLKRHLLNRGVQTDSLRTIYRDDSATVLATQSVSVTGTTQDRGRTT